MELRDKVAIVTGASSGIGLATAHLLTKQGVKVVLASRSIEKLKEISGKMPGSLPIRCDMIKPDEVKGMIARSFEHFGRIDILVNNAGQGYDSPVEKTNIGTLRGIFDLDFVGPLVAMEDVIPIMRKQGGGAIVNISSGTVLMTLPNNGAYSSIKRALATLSLTAREELKKDNIAVSVVYPYMTLTDFEKNTIKNDVPEWEGEPPHPPDTAEYIAGKILDAIKTGDSEIFAHDWMKTMGKGEEAQNAP